MKINPRIALWPNKIPLPQWGRGQGEGVEPDISELEGLDVDAG